MRRSKLLLAIFAMALITAACSEAATTTTTTATAAPTTTTTGAPGATPTTTAAPTADEIFQAEWATLIAAAQAEGELVIVASTGNSTSQSAIWERFGETFGIEIVQSTGSTSDVNARVLTERSQGLYEVDVAVCGTSCQTGFLEGEALTPLTPLLIDPDIEDRSLWHVEEFPWVRTDIEKMYISEYLLRVEPNIFRTFYNTENVTQEDLDSITSWYDFIDNPRWHGRIVTENPVADDGTSSEVARAWITFGGSDFLERLYREAMPDVAGIGVEREMVDDIARGTYDFSFIATGATSPATSAIEQGLPIAQLTKTLKEGAWTDLTGHFSAFDQAPHPAAQQLFVNWMLSFEGQTAINELLDPDSSVGELALRRDVPQMNIADDIWATVSDPNYVAVLQPRDVVRAATDSAVEFLATLFAELGHDVG